MRKLKLREGTNTAVLFGHHDRHLKLIEHELGVRLSARGEELTLDGLPDAVRQAERILLELASLTNGDYKWHMRDYGAYGYGPFTPYLNFTLNQ